MLLDIVRLGIGEAGEPVKGFLNVPPTVRALTREMLKRYAQTGVILRTARATVTIEQC
jgi:hypothetical protein